MPQRPPEPTDADGPKHLSVDLQILHLLAHQVSKVPWPVGAAALVVCIMGWGTAPAWALLSWTLSIWLVQAIRWRVLRHLPESKRPMPERMQIAVLLSGINGVCHALAVGFFPYLNDGQRSVLSLLLAGITTGAVGTTSGHPRIFHAFALPTMLGLAMGWAWVPLTASSSWIGLAMATFLVAYQGILSSLAKGAYGALNRSIKMQIKQWRMNRQLREALKQAEQANAAKTRFLASASHDLRQPLHTLTLFCAALENHPLTPDTKAIVGHMNGALDSLRHQLSALLDISKLDAGLVNTELKTIEVREYLHQIFTAFGPQANQKHLAFLLETDGLGPTFITTDPRHLDRILHNLIDNAIKYCQAGSITLGAKPLSDSVLSIYVQDTGIGIPPAEIPHIFEEFYQVANPERDRQLGLGLGLAIVHRLATLLDLRVEIQSAPGIGTTASFQIPISPPPSSLPSERPAAMSDLLPCHILVIDDEPAILAGMQALLEPHGCKVSVAENMEQAWSVALETTPDIVLADFRLRGHASGIQAIKQLQQRWPTLPGILVSGDTSAERLKQAHDAGLTLLHKPISVPQLFKALSEIQ